MKKFPIFLVSVILIFGITQIAEAKKDVTVYRSEKVYLKALAKLMPDDQNCHIFRENFENSNVWPRTILNGKPSVTHKGLKWTANRGKVATSLFYGKTNNCCKNKKCLPIHNDWGVFDTGLLPPCKGDALKVFSHPLMTLYGVGGWFKSSWLCGENEIDIKLDGKKVKNLDGSIECCCSTFWGVIKKSGFDNFKIYGNCGNWGADNFTFGACCVPEPVSSVLFLIGGTAIAAARRYRKRKSPV